MTTKPFVNELDPALLGVAGMSPFMAFDSSSRLNMFCGHIAQSLPVKGATIRRTQSGHEREYGKYTHAYRMPCNANIIKVIQKYPPTLGIDNIKENPTVAVIYEDVDSPKREIGVMILERFHCSHQYFGFPYQYKSAANHLTTGAQIPKGTVIADSPLVTDDGDYMFGLEAQIALASLPGVIEDGVIASESFCKRLTTYFYSSSIASWGKNRYPLNIYGDENNYKPFPDIGDRVRADGLVFALRDHDPFLAISDMSPAALREHRIFDKLFYATPGAKVIDIIVHRGSSQRTNMPTGMDTQTQKYYNRSMQFYQQLLHEYHVLKARRKDHLALTPEFERLLTDAIAITTTDPKVRVQKVRRTVPLDEWVVEVVLEAEIVPRIGFKVTDCHGGKGIIVKIMKDEHMPVDAQGNRAEVIMDDFSTVKRMNIGRTVEITINASGRATALKVKEMLGGRSQAEINAAWEYLLGWFKIVSPLYVETLYASGAENRKLQFLEDVADHGIYVWTPVNSPKSYQQVAEELKIHYPPCLGPVTYTGNSGIECTTRRPVIIGGLYMMLLEKIGNTWSGVSSSLLQHFGIPAKLTNHDKTSRPGRENPIRIMGETEVRLVAAHCSPDTAAEILDRSNNPETHRAILRSILNAPKPGNIDVIVDRSKVPRGNGRVVSYVRHMAECAGFEIVDGSKKQ